MSNERERIVVAMSGGVDSSVAAALLVEAGHDVVGLFMRNGVVASAGARKGKQGCCSLDDSMDARHVAGLLDIPFFAVNFKADFARIIDYFVDEYDRGRTPNPCVRCNRELKFGRLLDYADEIGATRVATGHYARLVERDGRFTVARGRDRDKDQSYVLFPLEQAQLRRTLLPLGGMTKAEVRREAERLDLPVFDKPDSQEICFVPDNDYGNLLRRRRPEGIRPGPLLDLDGRVVGEHEGHQLYTIGQRKGLGGGHAAPVFVVAIRAADNAVVIGGRDDLRADGLEMSAVTWMATSALGPDETRRGEVMVRAHHAPVAATATGGADGSVRIAFEESVRAVTPGQGAVFYIHDEIQFGGWIDAPLHAAAERADGG